MAVSAYIVTPNALSLNSAYRPIILRVIATATAGGPVPPVVYCDIYLNGVYYKTIAKSQYKKLNSTTSEWQFDLQDAAQEYLTTILPPVNGSELFNNDTSAVLIFARCRASGIDSRGFIIPEGVEPVQATGDTAAVSGDGTESLHFWALNASLQHEDNQNLQAHLNTFKYVLWANQYFPVTHRPNPYYITPEDSDFYPIANPVDIDKINALALFVQFTGQNGSGFLRLSTAVESLPGANRIDIPAGPQNLNTLFPSIDFKTVSRYYVQALQDNGPGAVSFLATSPMYELKKSCADKIRICFINYLGTIDAINFEVINVDHVTTSGKWQAPATSPLVFFQHSVNRLNISSNDIVTCSSVAYGEEAQDWIAELLDSPAAWLEHQGTQGLPDNYLPIVITDGKITKRKEDDRYTYETEITFTLSNNTIIPRI